MTRGMTVPDPDPLRQPDNDLHPGPDRLTALDLPRYRQRHSRQTGRGHLGLLTALLLLFIAAAFGAFLLVLVQAPAKVPSGPTSATSTPAAPATTPSPATATMTTSPSPSVSATSSATTPAAQEAAALVLFPASGSACGDVTGDYASCPVSSRMEQRLAALYAVAGRPYRPMCRCSRNWDSVDISETAAPSTLDVTFTFPGGRVTMMVSMVAGPGGSEWVADDTTCDGADIYSQTDPPACWAPG
jgi:hypothetical protein